MGALERRGERLPMRAIRARNRETAQNGAELEQITHESRMRRARDNARASDTINQISNLRNVTVTTIVDEAMIEDVANVAHRNNPLGRDTAQRHQDLFTQVAGRLLMKLGQEYENS